MNLCRLLWIVVSLSVWIVNIMYKHINYMKNLEKQTKKGWKVACCVYFILLYIYYFFFKLKSEIEWGIFYLNFLYCWGIYANNVYSVDFFYIVFYVVHLLIYRECSFGINNIVQIIIVNNLLISSFLFSYIFTFIV